MLLRLLLAHALAFLALAVLGRAAPNLGFAYPAGGQRGTTVTVSVGGQQLTGASAAYFSIPGAEAKVVSVDKPLSQREFNDAREKQQELQQKRSAARAAAKDPKAEKVVFTEADEKALEAVRQLLTKRPIRLTTPAIAETVVLEVKLPADAKPGDYDFRVRTPQGLSNPLVFQVSEIPESVAPAITSSINPPASTAGREAEIRNPAKKSAREVKSPVVVNGQIMPGEVDRIRFPAKQGEKLTLAVSARTLIPYLADAVPGWFQVSLAVYDPQGREIAYDDHYRFSPDPVLTCVAAMDGDYTVEIKDSIYRGREDFVYRIAIGELPFLSGIFPLGSGSRGAATFDLDGWNLPSEHLTIPAGERSAGTFLLAVRNQGRLSNSVKFAVDSAPEVMEATAPHHTRAAAQAIPFPALINGRIAGPDDHDFYTFEGKAGQSIVAEVLARRLQSPLDSVLELTDAAGKRLALNDDFEDKGAGLLTHQADSRISVTLPADGKYFLRLSDAQHRGGRDYAYRLRVSPPKPDFELRIVPSTLNVRAGSSLPVTIYALRHDGFAGEIVLGLKDAPRGFVLSGARIPAGQDKVQVTLTAATAPQEEPTNLQVIGRGGEGDQAIFHSAVPADDMMQAFLYRHLVVARELKVNVIGRGAMLRPLASAPLKLTTGGESRLTIAAPVARGINAVRIELSEPPDGITVKRSSLTRDGFEVVFACDPEKVKPGAEGNLILTAYGERPGAKGSKQAQRTPIGTAPAIPFTVVAGKKST
jgi:hypothetical protein